MKTLQRITSLGCMLLCSSLCYAAQGPPGMPKEMDTSGLVLNEPEAFQGFTLIAPLTGTLVFLVNMAGEVVHQWDLPTGTESAILLPNGNLLRWGLASKTAFQDSQASSDKRFKGPGVAGGLIEEVDWEGNSRWRFVLDNDEQLLHHDIALLPNGNILFLAWENRFREDAIAWGRDPDHVSEQGMWPDAVYEIKPLRGDEAASAEVVWEWHSWDHLIQDFDETKQNYGSVRDHPGKIDINVDHRGRLPLTQDEIEEQAALEEQMAALGYGGDDEEEDDSDDGDDASRPGHVPDWLHTNAIDYLPSHDLIVLSSPHLNELLIIDHSTTTLEAANDSGGRFGKGGEILWRWGNPRNYGMGTELDQQLSFQHDPTWIPSESPNELRILVYNNGRLRHGAESYSSVDELVIPFDSKKGFIQAAGTAHGPAQASWSFSQPGTLYSSFISGAQRLPNGNTLICSGAQGRVLEVTPSGEVVWDYRNPHTGSDDVPVPANSLYRAVRFSKDHPGLADKNL